MLFEIADAFAEAVKVFFTSRPFLPAINTFSFCHAPEPQNQPRFPFPFDTEISGPLPALIAASDLAISILPTEVTDKPGFAASIRLIAAFHISKLPPLYGDQTVTVRVAAVATLEAATRLPTTSAMTAKEANKRFFCIISPVIW